MKRSKYNHNFKEGFEHCGICKKQFEEGKLVGVTSFPQNPCVIICNDCIKYLKNLYSDMVETSKELSIPTEEIEIDIRPKDKLWRYMDLAKFIYMLKNSALYFSSPNKFDDIYEGAYGELRNKKEWDHFHLLHMKANIIISPNNCWHSIDRDDLKPRRNDWLKNWPIITMKVFS